jgi:hypothetical protein
MSSGIVVMSIVLPVLILAVGLFILNVILLAKHWNTLHGWAKAMYVIFLFTGIGPVPSIVLLYLGVGIDPTLTTSSQ